MPLPNVAKLRCVLAVAAGLIGAETAGAQDLRGTVSDSVTRQPIPGAVVILLDAAGETVARNITNARGEYRLAAPLTAKRVRVVRLGFRPREVPFPPPIAARDAAAFDVAMVSIPTMLEEVRVVASTNCPSRSDRAAALALLEQARAGLLTAVVARSARAARMEILRFDRSMDGTSNRIERQSVRFESADVARTSFRAARTAREFVRAGFVLDAEGERMYFGPDADVLLDDAFAAGYCFHLRPAESGRPNQVGLAFTPAARRRGRVDVDGTLWIDTVRRALIDIEFRYIDLAPGTDAVKPGGRVSFWEMNNGVVFIDRWFFRLPAVGGDTTYDRNNRRVVRQWYYARESGGEVASAKWTDDHEYHAPLGALHGRAIDLDGKAVSAGVIRLAETDYVASPDSLGFFEITNLLPGPYVAMVLDTSVARLGITLPTALRFVAERDSVHRTRLLMPTPEGYVRFSCLRPEHPQATDSPWVTYRVETADKKPVPNAKWELSKDFGTSWQRVIETGTTDAEGLFRPCIVIERGDVLSLRAWRDNERPMVGSTNVWRKGMEVTITLPEQP